MTGSHFLFPAHFPRVSQILFWGFAGTAFKAEIRPKFCLHFMGSTRIWVWLGFWIGVFRFIVFVWRRLSSSTYDGVNLGNLVAICEQRPFCLICNFGIAFPASLTQFFFLELEMILCGRIIFEFNFTARSIMWVHVNGWAIVGFNPNA